MVGSASGPGSTFKAFLGSARVRVPLSNKIQVRVGSVQHIYGSLRVRVRILGPVKTSSQKPPKKHEPNHVLRNSENTSKAMWDAKIFDKPLHEPSNKYVFILTELGIDLNTET